MGFSFRKRHTPWIMAARVVLEPPGRTTSTMGVAVATARCQLLARVVPATPSKQPMTPSITAKSWPKEAEAKLWHTASSRLKNRSRLRLGTPSTLR